MSKSNNIIYWVSTIWLSLGMLVPGIVQLIQLEEETAKMQVLGYPAYFLTIIGAWKILGVIAILVPKFPLVKEWAYAGFFFVMSGAIFTHFAVCDPAMEYFGPALLLILTCVSWKFRPESKKLISK